MYKLAIIFLTASILTSFNLSAEEKEDSYGLVVKGSSSSKKTEMSKEKSRIGCRSEANSYTRYVKPVKGYSKRDEVSLKKHLECWEDKDVMIMLAKIYVKRKSFYLAKKVYLEIGAQKEVQLIDEILKANEKPENREKFMQQSLKIAVELKKKSEELKALGITFSIIGPMLAGAGFGLFLHEKAFDGQNSKTAQFSLMLGGLSLLGGGITINYFADYKRAISESYRDIAWNHYEIGATPTQSYEFSKIEAQTRKKMIRKLRAHGASLILLSIPLFIVSGFSIYEIYQAATREPTYQFRTFTGAILFWVYRYPLAIIGGIVTLVPGIACLIGGISMIVHSYRWEKNENPKSAITLSSITPMIDPISRSYGINVGFSF